jgi:polysaccharide export outer membrane protein
MLALLLLLLQTAPGPAAPPAKAAALPASPAADEYRIGPQDILAISVFGHDDLTQTVVVQADGTISYPLVGRMPAADKTPKQLEADLTRRLGTSYVRNPQVSVAVKEYRSRTVLVAGEIAHPGTYPLAGNMTIVEIIAKAGPMSAAAGAEAIIVRPKGEAKGPVLPADIGSDAVEVFRVNVGEIESGNLAGNIVLHPNDTVFIPVAPRVFVSGEVNRPGAYPFTPATTVRQVLILAGGMTDDGSPGRIRVLRTVAGKLKESKIGIDDKIQAGDTILVKAKLF